MGWMWGRGDRGVGGGGLLGFVQPGRWCHLSDGQNREVQWGNPSFSLAFPSANARLTGRYTSLTLLCSKNARHAVGTWPILVEPEARSRYFAGLVCFQRCFQHLAPSAVPRWPQRLSRTSWRRLLITSWSYSGKPVCFYSLHFFKNVPSARSLQATRQD